MFVVSIPANRFTLEDIMFEHTMFAESILETSWAQRTRRSWMTVTSFGLQALVIGLLLLLPLWKTVGVPTSRTLSTPISLGRTAAEPPQTAQASPAHPTQSNFQAGRFMQPSRIPTLISMTAEEPSAPATIGAGTGIEGAGLPGSSTGLPASLFNGSRSVLPSAPAPVVRTFRTSNMLEGSLIRRVQPVYPPLARSARIQGSVVLFAVISKAGGIDNLRIVAGHPLLVPAAIDAVRQWRYRPYILNSEPIEVETQITVNFLLSGN
jgi:periplasmic protein TonB